MRFLRYQWDRIGAWMLIVVGVLMLVRGWVGVSRSPFVAEQLPYVISAGLGGLVAVGVGAMLWLSADLRDEWRKLEEIKVVLERGDSPLDDLDEGVSDVRDDEVKGEPTNNGGRRVAEAVSIETGQAKAGDAKTQLSG